MVDFDPHHHHHQVISCITSFHTHWVNYALQIKGVHGRGYVQVGEGVGVRAPQPLETDKGVQVSGRNGMAGVVPSHGNSLS